MVARVAIALLLVVVGAVWIGQGVGVIGGSFMTGQGVWAIIGAVMVLFGISLAWGVQRERSRGDDSPGEP